MTRHWSGAPPAEDLLRLLLVLHLLAVERAARTAAAGLAVAPGDGAVAEHRVDTPGRRDRLLEGCGVDHRRRIEDAEVGIVAGLHLAALGEMEALGRVRRHAAHCVLQREEL